MITRWRQLARGGRDRGAHTTVEAVIAIFALAALLVFVVSVGVVMRTNSAVSAAAAAAARAASVKSQPTTARAAGNAAATAALDGVCISLYVTVDVSQMSDPQPGSAVVATIECTHTWLLAGSFTASATETSPIDVLREGP